MKLTFLGAAILAAFASVAPGATISFNALLAGNGTFDVVVQATNLFAGRDPASDGIISYGFDIGISNPALLSFNGATSGALFDPAVTEPGTDVFGSASNFGIFAPATEPLILATLHFTRTAPGSVNIVISSDLSNPFQGLQFLNAPFAESISGTVTVGAVPEPGTIALAVIGLIAMAGLRGRKLIESGV